MQTELCKNEHIRIFHFRVEPEDVVAAVYFVEIAVQALDTTTDFYFLLLFSIGCENILYSLSEHTEYCLLCNSQLLINSTINQLST